MKKKKSLTGRAITASAHLKILPDEPGFDYFIAGFKRGVLSERREQKKRSK